MKILLEIELIFLVKTATILERSLGGIVSCA